MRFIKLTRPHNQGEVWVNPLLVRYMHPNHKQGTHIIFATERMADGVEVCETPSQIARWVQGGKDAD